MTIICSKDGNVEVPDNDPRIVAYRRLDSYATRLNLSEYRIQHTEWLNNAKRRGPFRFLPHPIVKEIVDNMLPQILSGKLSPQRALAVFNLGKENR